MGRADAVAGAAGAVAVTIVEQADFFDEPKRWREPSTPVPFVPMFDFGIRRAQRINGRLFDWEPNRAWGIWLHNGCHLQQQNGRWQVLWSAADGSRPVGLHEVDL